MDYRGRDEGAVLAPWVRFCLEGNPAGAESLTAYDTSYLFVSTVRSTRREAVIERLRTFSVEQDFSRLVAERIRLRFNRDVSGDPNEWYGFNYERTIKAAYRVHFWGSLRRDDMWVLASADIPTAGEAVEPAVQGAALSAPLYWGFILISIPKETLEVQINTLFQNVGTEKNTVNRELSREQNTAFAYIKEHFFEYF